MEYISAKEAAALWGIDASRIGKYAREGRIEGARIVGRNWLIPKNAKKPADGRTKASQPEGKKDVFRFPFYMNFSEDSFLPPLSEEERELRSAELLFLECRFEEAKRSFDLLLYRCQSSHVRSCALFFLCYLSVCNYYGRDYDRYYTCFGLELSADHAYRREMELLHPLLMCHLSLYKNAAESFQIDVTYDYSPSVYPVMSILSMFNESTVNVPEAAYGVINYCETASKLLEHEGHLYEAQIIHVILFAHHSTRLHKAEALYHLKKIADIAYEQGFIYPLADIFVYYSDEFNSVLQDYPEEFGEKVRLFGKQIHESFAEFTEQYGITNLYTLLSERDYQYIRFAVLGYSGGKIAKALHISERTVASHYAALYEKLGVKGKKELAAMFTESFFKTQQENER